MDFAAARRNMVDSQIRPNKVTDERVVDALATVPREAFVSEAKQGLAYIDDSIAIEGGRFVMAPMVLARLLQTLDIRAEDVALSIGSGTGYAAAVLARLVSTVVAVENDKGLAQHSTRVLTDLEIDNVAVMDGPLADGYPKQAPYDVIFFDGAVDDIPDAVAGQLTEGGRLVAVVLTSGGIGRAVLVTRHGDTLSRREVFDCNTPKLPEFDRDPAFIF